MEIPYRKKYVVNYANKNNYEQTFVGTPLFKERQYSDAAIHDRITNNIRGVLLKKVVLYERIPFDYIWNKLPKIVTTIFAFFEPWIDILNIACVREGRQLEKGKSVILIYKIS